MCPSTSPVFVGEVTSPRPRLEEGETRTIVSLVFGNPVDNTGTYRGKVQVRAFRVKRTVAGFFLAGPTRSARLDAVISRLISLGNALCVSNGIPIHKLLTYINFRAIMSRENRFPAAHSPIYALNASLWRISSPLWNQELTNPSFPLIHPHRFLFRLFSNTYKSLFHQPLSFHIDTKPWGCAPGYSTKTVGQPFLAVLRRSINDPSTTSDWRTDDLKTWRPSQTTVGVPSRSAANL